MHIFQRALDYLMEIIPDESKIDDDFWVSCMYYQENSKITKVL